MTSQLELDRRQMLGGIALGLAGHVARASATSSRASGLDQS